MKTLCELATDQEIQDFLLYHMDKADDSRSKINPALTKQQVWDINMGAVISGNTTRAKNIIIKNIISEFGKHYEG